MFLLFSTNLFLCKIPATYIAQKDESGECRNLPVNASEWKDVNRKEMISGFSASLNGS